MKVQQIGKYERGEDRIAASTLEVLSRSFGVRPGRFYDGLAQRAGVAEEGRLFDRSDAPKAARTGLLEALAVAPLTTQRRAIRAALAALKAPPG